MTEFHDSTGRSWALILTLGSAKRIFEKTGVDLLNPLSLMKVDSNGVMDYENSTLPRFFTDDIFVGEILTQLVGKQAKERGISEGELLDIFDGETTKKAQDAFLGEYNLFFTARGNQVGRRMVEMIRQGMENLATEDSVGEMSLQSQDVQESQTSAS